MREINILFLRSSKSAVEIYRSFMLRRRPCVCTSTLTQIFVITGSDNNSNAVTERIEKSVLLMKGREENKEIRA